MAKSSADTALKESLAKVASLDWQALHSVVNGVIVAMHRYLEAEGCGSEAPPKPGIALSIANKLAKDIMDTLDSRELLPAAEDQRKEV
jgi:hypothetical protein